MMGRLGALVDAESVRPFQSVVYVAYVGAGAQALVTGSPPGAVEQAMGSATAMAWAGLLVGGPLLTLIGILMRRSIAGLLLQLAGDAAVSFASLAYAAAILQTSYSGRATYAAWVAAALSICGAVMVARGIRRIRALREIVHRIEDERAG